MASPFEGRGEHAAGSLTLLHQPTRSRDLTTVSLVDLSSELLARLKSGEKYGANVLVGEQLQQLLASAVNVHENCFSAKRYLDQFELILRWVGPQQLQGKTVVDLGCGSLNPFTFSFLLLALGAERAYAIDIEPIQDITFAIETLARAASWLLLDSTKVFGAARIAPEDVLRKLNGFQLRLLAAGNPDGIASHRLQHRVDSVYDLSFANGEVDAVFSVSVFEHLEHPEDAIESLRRITRPGGIGHHVVDFSDHRIYAEMYDIRNPREFLKAESFEPIDHMHWSNRIRCDELCAMFEQHGFAVEGVEALHTEPLSDEELTEFVQPYRSLSRKNLQTIVARILVRR